MGLEKKFLVVSVIFVFFSGTIPTGNFVLAQEDQTNLTPQEIFTNLLQTAQNDGTVKVIIELNQDYTTPGQLSPQENTVQKNNIQGMQNEVLNSVSSNGITKSYSYKYLPLIALTVDSEALTDLQSSSLVKGIHEDRDKKIFLDSSVPLIGADKVHDGTISGIGPIEGWGYAVAVVDTGVDLGHQFFSGKTVTEACFKEDFSCPGGFDELKGVAGAAVPCSGGGCNHGTHVAGIALSNDNTYTGVAPKADLIAIQIFQDTPDGPTASTSDEIKALEYVMELQDSPAFTTPIASVNLSLGIPNLPFFAPCDTFDAAETMAFNAVRSKNIAPVVSAGNDGFINALSSPACIQSAISVGSTDVDSHNQGLNDDDVSFFTNVASFLDLYAPGILIFSAKAGTLSNTLGLFGTSMSAPHVAGAWALLMEQNPNYTVDEILAILKDTGKPITDSGGLGTVTPRINLESAIIAGLPVGGADMPIDMVSLLVYGFQANAIWWLPAVLMAGVSIALFQIKRKN